VCVEVQGACVEKSEGRTESIAVAREMQLFHCHLGEICY